jgi:hypothetical protein
VAIYKEEGDKDPVKGVQGAFDWRAKNYIDTVFGSQRAAPTGRGVDGELVRVRDAAKPDESCSSRTP